MAHPQRPIHLILDFDGTLTTNDTLITLANIGYNKFPNTQPSWEDISSAYMTDHEAHASSYKPSAAERTTTAEEVAYLRSLRETEEVSAARVEKAGFLRNLDAKAVREGAGNAVKRGEVTFRRGWVEIITHIRQNMKRDASSSHMSASTGVSILSVNFSRYFVHRCLMEAAEEQGKQEQKQNIESVSRKVAIYANEMCGIDEKEEDCISGRVADVRTSGDKMTILRELVNPPNGGEKPLSVYVGDSTTDMECLLAADVGICIREEEMRSGQKELAQTLSRVGIRVDHISQYPRISRSEHDPGAERRQVALWWAQDFHEVNELISALLNKQ